MSGRDGLIQRNDRASSLACSPNSANAGVMSTEHGQALTEPEQLALRLLAQRPTASIAADILEKLLAKRLVERFAGSLLVTSRGHSVLLDQDLK